MKKIIIATIFCVVLLFAGCADKKAQPENDKKNEEVSENLETAVTVDMIKGAADSCSNIRVSDNLKIAVPKNVEALYTFDRSFYELTKNSNDAYEAFKTAAQYIYPDEEINEQNISFCNERFTAMMKEYQEIHTPFFMDLQQKCFTEGSITYEEFQKLEAEFNKEHLPAIPKVADFKAEIESGNENVSCYLVDGYDKDGKRFFMESQLPVINGLFRINRGVAAENYYKSKGEEVPFLETCDSLLAYINLYVDDVKECSPDSEESFKLFDKEMSVKDAVAFFEKYVNEIPLAEDSVAKVKVLQVLAVKLGEDKWGFQFICSSEYKGIMFDYFDIVQGYSTEGNKGNPVYTTGTMVRSDEVDSVYCPVRIPRIINEQKISGMVDCSQALKNVSESLSDAVSFELRSVELVWFTDMKDGTILDEKAVLKTKAQWKYVLFNSNDRLYYVCYVNLSDGKDFHYYKMKAN